jgi:ribosomal protein L2
MNPVDHPYGGGEGRAPIGREKPLGVGLHSERGLIKVINIIKFLFCIVVKKARRKTCVKRERR